jgi:hypothetical protein
MIHHATTIHDEQTFDWASLDGDHWLPVSRPPQDEEDEDVIRALFEGDGNFKPMTFGRAWLLHWGAQFTS